MLVKNALTPARERYRSAMLPRRRSLPHQARDSLAPDVLAGVFQGAVHPRAAVVALVRSEHAAHLLEQLGIALRMCAGLAPRPRVIARPGHAPDPAHHFDPVRFPLGVDELEDFALRSETNRMAFFRFFSQLRERRTADPANLLVSRQQIGAGRGRDGFYVRARGLGRISSAFLGARGARLGELARLRARG